MSQSTVSPEAIITNFVEGIRDPLTFVLVITSLCACLITLLIVLFVFSTRELRKRLIFRLNVIAICFALTLGVLNFIVSGSAILRPFDPVPQSLYITTIAAALLPPVFYDSILLTRLLALYPVDRTPLPVLIRILAFPICVKCGRLVVLSLYVWHYAGESRDLATFSAHAQATWYRNPFVTTEWTLQMFDNLYSSGLFIYQLHTQSAQMSPVAYGSHVFSFPEVGNIGKRIREIFYISVANFVFPVLFNIGQIICITADPSFYLGTLLLLSNTYVSVIGVLFATIWVSGGEYVRRQTEGNTPETSLRFTPFERRAFGPTRQLDIGSGFKAVEERGRQTPELSKTDVDFDDLELHKITSEIGLPSDPYSTYSNIEVHIKQDVEQA